MTIMEAAYAVDQKYQETSNLLDKIGIYDESAMYDLNSEIQRAELDTLYEFKGGDSKKASSDKYAEKAKALIDKIITAVLDAIEEFRAKLDDVFNTIKKKNVLGKAEEVLKKNPLAAKRKMKYTDSSKAVQVYEAALQKLTSITAKVKANIANDSKKFDKDLSDFEDDIAKKAKAGYKTVTITIGEGVEKIKKCSTSFTDLVKAKTLSSKDKSDCAKYINKLESLSDDVSNKAHKLVSCISLKAKIEKERAAAITKQILSMVDGLKSSISESIHNIKESYEDILNYGEHYEESTVDTSNYVEGLDLDNYLDDIMKESSSYDPVIDDDILADVDFFSESLERNDISSNDIYVNEGVNTSVRREYISTYSDIKLLCKEANNNLKKNKFDESRKCIYKAQKLNKKAYSEIEKILKKDPSVFPTISGILMRCASLIVETSLSVFVSFKILRAIPKINSPVAVGVVDYACGRAAKDMYLAGVATQIGTGFEIYKTLVDLVRISKFRDDKIKNGEELSNSDYNTFVNTYKALIKNNDKYFAVYLKVIDKKEKKYNETMKEKIEKESVNNYLDNLLDTLND